jgi:di/tricarboxylate transporter
MPWQDNATVLAIHRRGEVLRNTLREARLNVGDVLLMLVRADGLPPLKRNRDLIVLSTREEPGGQRRRAWLSLAIMATVVGTAAFGWLPIVTSAILGCLALVLSRCLAPEEVYEAIDWRVVVLLAGVLPLGIALQESGAAALAVRATLGLLGDSGPLLALAAIYLLTALLTEAMSNNATAVLMVPIGFATAEALGVDPTPFLVAVAFAASTSFATPVGYQTNTMVYSLGGYRFADFLRVGLPLNLLFWMLAVWLIPRWFPF